MPDHLDIIRRAFSLQAADFERKGHTLTCAEYLEWMVNALPLEANFQVLDVAAGTGLLSRAIAPRVREVVAVDATPAMLQAAAGAIQGEGLQNIVLENGLAERLPFPDDSFDMVVSRLAFHHFDDPREPLREMRRVCRPSRVVAVLDLLSPPEEGLRERYNQLERLRDPSHTRALAREEMIRAASLQGLTPVFVDQREITVDMDRWLATAGTPKEVRIEIKDLLGRELRTAKRPG